MTKLKLLVVDDSAMYRQALQNIIKKIPGVECIGTASNGEEAMRKIIADKPDVVTLDMEMPIMSGMEVIEAVTEQKIDTKLVIVSACSQSGAEKAIMALKLGAYDFITKPDRIGGGSASDDISRQLSEKIQALRISTAAPSRPVPSALNQSRNNAALAPRVSPDPFKAASPILVRPKVIVVGCSTGGPKALLKLFAGLKGALDIPIFVVQHMPPLFTQTLASSINDVTSVTVKEAEDGEKPLPNYAYIAPGGRQMKLIIVDGDIEIKITDDQPTNFCKPSVDYFFSSVADVYGSRTLAVILSGMGSDGTEGLKKIKQNSGVRVLGQDEASSVVYGMPRVAMEAGVVDQQWDIADMPAAIESVIRY